MNGSNSDRAFADGRGDAFDIARANVTNSKHSGQTRFEVVRRASHWPTRRSQVVSRQVRPRLDESLTVEKHAPAESARVWNRSGHDEDVANFARLGFSSPIVAPGYTFEMMGALESEISVRVRKSIAGFSSTR